MSFANGRYCTYLFSTEINHDRKTTINRLKNQCLSNLKNTVFNDPTFQAIAMGATSELGSHSLRKYAATWANQNGCSMDDVETRGRWKRNTRRTASRYVSVEQPHVDAKVEAILCVGGLIAYRLIADSGVTMEWVKEHVIPGISAHYGIDSTACDFLGLAPLWVCMEVTQQHQVPPTLLQKVITAYNLLNINIVEPAINPVQRVCLTVYNVNRQLCIDKIDNTNGD
jgi:hypothetical protein